MGIFSLLLIGCLNTQILDNNNTVIYDVRCESNVTVIYEHKSQERLYLIKDEGNYRVLKEHKTGKILQKVKK